MMELQDLFSTNELSLLHSRAERIAVPINSTDTAGSITVLVTQIHHENYAIPIADATSVFDKVSIVPIPGVPAYVAGIANLRGYITTVLNLGILLGLDCPRSPTSAAVLSVASQYGNVGFVIEGVGEVIEMSLSLLRSVPANATFEHPEYFSGIFDNGTALLKLSNILLNSEIIVNDGAN